MGLYGLSGTTLSSNRWVALLILYITSAVFAITYHVNDQFVFNLPSYVAFSFFVAKGFQRFSAATRPGPQLTRAMVMLRVIMVPASVYAFLPCGLLASGLNPLGIRPLPGREPNRYIFGPASRGDYGALAY